jgi:hypothetical protein
MKTILMIAAVLSVPMLSGCATYASDNPPGSYYFYDIWGDGGGGVCRKRRSRGVLIHDLRVRASAHLRRLIRRTFEPRRTKNLRTVQ